MFYFIYTENLTLKELDDLLTCNPLLLLSLCKFLYADRNWLLVCCAHIILFSDRASRLSNRFWCQLIMCFSDAYSQFISIKWTQTKWHAVGLEHLGPLELRILRKVVHFALLVIQPCLQFKLICKLLHKNTETNRLPYISGCDGEGGGLAARALCLLLDTWILSFWTEKGPFCSHRVNWC